jgi:predicted RNase H-like nuclease (RuvC/YqgF family)
MGERVQLDAVRIRREALYEAVVGLEDALTTPVGDGHKWRLRVAMAVDHAAVRIEEHAQQTEAKGGFLEKVLIEEPRLQRKINQLKVDHERLEKEVDALRTAVSLVDDDAVPDQSTSIRNRAIELLGQLTRHRQRGADLIYEAYQVDIGGTGATA